MKIQIPKPVVLEALRPQYEACAESSSADKWQFDTESECFKSICEQVFTIRKQSSPIFKLDNPGQPQLTSSEFMPQPTAALFSPETYALIAAANRGLGDDVEAVAKSLGLDKVAHAFEEITGWSCGCETRKRLLNKLPSVLTILRKASGAT